MIEREKERVGEKKNKPFSDDFTGFCRSKLGRSRVKAALRDESYTWVLESQDFAKVQGWAFTDTDQKAVSREITLIEVRFLSYSV